MQILNKCNACIAIINSPILKSTSTKRVQDFQSVYHIEEEITCSLKRIYGNIAYEKEEKSGHAMLQSQTCLLKN